MQLERLKSLYLSMSATGLTRIALACRVTGASLDVAMLTEPGNHGIFIGQDGQWVFLAVTSGGLINPVLPHQDYVRILKMVKAEAQKGVFKTGQFFQELDAALPDKAETRMVLRTHVAAQLFPQVLEVERQHFLGFQSPIPGASVTEQNLEKTRMLLGAEAYKLCRALNRSSHWSQSAGKAVRILPELAQLRKEALGLARRKPVPATTTIAVASPPAPVRPQPQPIETDALTAVDADNPPARSVSAGPPVLVLVCGLSGTGKTALAKRLARRLANAVALDPDIFTVPLVEAALRSHDIGLTSPGAAYLVNHLFRAGRYTALISLAFEMLSQGRSPVCVFDMTRDLSQVPVLKSQMASGGLALKIVWLSTESSVRRARLAARGEFWDEYNLKHWEEQEAAVNAATAELAGSAVDVLVLDTTTVDARELAEQAAGFVAGPYETR
jgi:predicted kinase